MSTSILYKSLNPKNGIVIAETACNHEGDLKKIKKLINCVAKSKTNIIKFQVFTAEERVSKDHPEYSLYKQLSFSHNQWIKISKFSKNKGLKIFVDVFGEKSLEISNSMNVDGYKIHSSDLLNGDFIFKVAKKNKILLLGVGGSRRIEVLKLLKYLKLNKLNKYLIIMPGIQVFPTSIRSHSLSEIKEFNNYYRDFNVKVGFADHLSGDSKEAISLPLMALSMGACLVEKHFTINRKDKWEDYESSLGSEDFINFTYQAKKLSHLISVRYNFIKDEKIYRNRFKKSLFSKKFIPKNTIIKKSDICFKKTKKNFSNLSSFDIINKKTKVNIKKDTLIDNSKIINNIGIILLVRTNSERLKDKALLKINGKETITYLIERLKLSKLSNKIILATSSYKSDDSLINIAKKQKISFYRGSSENVISRIFGAAKKFKLDHVVRVTGDDILRDYEMIDHLIDKHLQGSFDVTISKKMPYGTSTEVMSLDVVETVNKKIKDAKNSEYLEYIIENDKYFNIKFVNSKYKFNPKIRLTLDYKEDFLLFKKILSHFKNQLPYLTLNQIIKYLQSNKYLLNINSSQKIKFNKNQIDTSLKI